MESAQMVDLVLMEQRLKNQWSYDEGAWRIREAHRLAREARAPWWARLAARRSRTSRDEARTVGTPAGAPAGASAGA